jgi:phosphatidylglycerophosphatase A
MQNIEELAIKKLNERGVQIRDISNIVYFLQEKYGNITIEQCDQMVLYVIENKEAAYAILTGIALDEMAEKKIIDNEINNIIKDDSSLYGIDEILGLSIINMHGSIALTNFGYVDKIKPGIIGKVDQLGKETNACHTFLDDIIGAIAAAAASRIAYSREEK